MKVAKVRDFRMADRLLTPIIMEDSGKYLLETWLSLVRNLSEGTNEIICHPGYVDDVLRKYAKYVQQREQKLRVLTSERLKREIENQRVELISLGNYKMSDLKNKVFSFFLKSSYLLRLIGTNIYGYLLAPRRFGGIFSCFYEFLQQSQWWTREQLEEFQLQRLQKILDIAYQNVPFYKKLFQGYEITPKDILSIKDLKKLSLISKDTIQKNPEEFLHQDIRHLSGVVKTYSSGTTGQKFIFYLPKTLAYDISYAMFYRAHSWAGINRRDKRVTLGGRIFTHRAPYWVFNKAENQLLLSIHHLNETTVDEYIALIKSFSPVFLQGNHGGLFYR